MIFYITSSRITCSFLASYRHGRFDPRLHRTARKGSDPGTWHGTGKESSFISHYKPFLAEIHAFSIDFQGRVAIFFTLLLSSVALIIVTFHWFGFFGHGAGPEPEPRELVAAMLLRCQGSQSRGQMAQRLG